MSTPKALSRREVLQTAGLLGISAAATREARAADTRVTDGLSSLKQSGLVTGKMKPLKYEEIPGLLSKAQVTPHYQAHYGGALKRYTTIEEELEKLRAGSEPLAGDAIAFMQKDKVNRMNSVLLHELYFENLTAKPPKPVKDIRTVLSKRFGSMDRWAEEFRACAMSANGWAILARDIVNGKLYNVSSDLHEVGVIWLGQPLIVCDVYEHAFYVDYQNRKQEYVDKFVSFIDWEEVNRRMAVLRG